MSLPPPGGTSLQNCICSALQMLRISSRNRIGSGGIGPTAGSATTGGGVARVLQPQSQQLRHRWRPGRAGSRRKVQAHDLAGIAALARHPAARPGSGREVGLASLTDRRALCAGGLPRRAAVCAVGARAGDAAAGVAAGGAAVWAAGTRAGDAAAGAVAGVPRYGPPGPRQVVLQPEQSQVVLRMAPGWPPPVRLAV